MGVVKSFFLNIFIFYRFFYKTYCFYRWISLDEKVQSNRWYSNDMGMYCLGEMFQIMRKEIGLNNELLQVDVPDVLSFYITDFTKPEFKKNFYKYHFRKFLLKSAIFWGKGQVLLLFPCRIFLRWRRRFSGRCRGWHAGENGRCRRWSQGE